MITNTKPKQKVTKYFTAILFALFILPTISLFVPSVNDSTVRAAVDCKDKYIAYKQNGADSGPTWAAWNSCLQGQAIEVCNSPDVWQSGNQSAEEKRNSCIYWFREGVKKPREATCNASRDPSGNNKKTCMLGIQTAQRYNAAYEQTQSDGAPRENPRDSETNNQGGTTQNGSGNGGASTPKPTVKQKDIPETDDPALDCAKNTTSNNDCDLVDKYLNPIIGFLSAFVGIAVTIGIISGGIRYASSSDDPQKAAAGRQMIRNALIALVAYIFLYAMIRWLLPQTK